MVCQGAGGSFLLVSQLVGFLVQVPAPNGVSKATAPTAQSIHILSEVEQVGADATVATAY